MIKDQVLNPDNADQPRDVLSRKVYYPGDILLREDGIANSAFLIESGEVEIFRTINNIEYPLAIVRSGAILGEMALIDDQPRMATARARTQTVAVVLARNIFEAKLSAADPFIAKILKVFLQNARTSAAKYVEARSKLDEIDHSGSQSNGGGESETEAKTAEIDDPLTVTMGMVEAGEDVYLRWSKNQAEQDKPNATTNLVNRIYKAMESERYSIK